MAERWWRRDVTHLEPLAVVLVAYFCGLAMGKNIEGGGWRAVAVYIGIVFLLALCGSRAAGWGVRSNNVRSYSKLRSPGEGE